MFQMTSNPFWYPYWSSRTVVSFLEVSAFTNV